MEYGVSLMVNASPTLENPNVSLRDPAAWQSYFGGGRSAAGLDVTPRSVLGFPPAYRAIELISSKIAGTPVNVFMQGDDRAEDRDHDIYKRFGKGQLAAPFLSSHTLTKTISAHALLYGNGYAGLVRNNRGNVVEVRLLDPTGTFLDRVDGVYKTVLAGEQFPIRLMDMLHIRSLSLDGIEGEAMISLMANAWGIPLAAQRHGSKWFANGSNMSGVLMYPGGMRRDQQENAMKDWVEATAGLENSNKVALVPGGVKYQPLSIPNDSAQFTETREHELRSTVANIYGIPPHLIGDTTRTSYNSIEQENQSLLSNCLRHWFDVWEAELCTKMFTPQARNTRYVEFNADDMVKMEHKTRVEGGRTQIEAGIATPNEVRKRFNLPSIGPEGDVHWRPANWLPLDQTEPPAPPAPPAAPEQADDEDTDAELVESLLRGHVRRYLAFESDKISRTAEKSPDGFWSGLEGFYDDWIARANLDGIDQTIVREAYAAHAARSQTLLLTAAGSATVGQLGAIVTDCVGDWPLDRVDELTTDIMERLKCKN